MVLARCARHKPTGRKHNYVASVEPKGGTESAILCPHCNRPALIWLTDEEYKEYQKGERIFHPPTMSVRFRAE